MNEYDRQCFPLKLRPQKFDLGDHPNPDMRDQMKIDQLETDAEGLLTEGSQGAGDILADLRGGSHSPGGHKVSEVVTTGSPRTDLHLRYAK
jgi:hypothetical protein